MLQRIYHSGPPANGTCTNHLGNFHCDCDDGYSASYWGQACTDRNECLWNQDNCHVPPPPKRNVSAH
ncbi:hypothetical protein T484DRAFT_1858390 [Baffinella frigidus]|nr:hypothetical protein T484DRAFT_1858390 [Cryptophyta sp. CCMP2293]